MLNLVVDELGRKLIELLQRNGRVTLVELSSELGMSHVGVRKRLQKLLSSGMVKVVALLNSRLFVYAVVFAELESYSSFKEIAEKLKDCPRMLFLAPLIGGMNYIAVMAFESMDVLEACMSYCVVRALKGIRRSEVLIAREAVVPKYIYFKVVSVGSEKAPCGVDCSQCSLYSEGKCPACPATKYYRFTENQVRK